MTVSATAPTNRIIDVHCGWGATAAAPQWNDVAAIRDALADRGIGDAFLSSTLSRRYDLAAGNDALGGALATVGRAGASALHGWLVIHPSRGADSNALMRKHLYNDAFVGAALYADPLTGTPVTLRESQEVINSFRRYARPLLIETLTAQAMLNAVEIADSLGGIKVVASGMGGDEWHEAIPLAARPLNLYLDISGALAPEKLSFAIEQFHGTRKLLFASGAPHTDPAAVLGMLDDLSLTSEDRDRILFINATRLFHLGPPPAAPAGLMPMPIGAGGSDIAAAQDLLLTLGAQEPPAPGDATNG